MRTKIFYVLIIVITIKLIFNICGLIDISYDTVLNEINSNKEYKFTVGPLPYKNKHFVKNEIERLYTFVDILNDIKTINYTNNNRIKQNKITIKLVFFKKNKKLNFELLENFIKYANKYNIMVGIASLMRYDRFEELNTYLKLLKLGYTNIFITLATYHDDINERVNLVLKHGGCVRLVKGWYNDGNVKDWKQVGKNYLKNAKKLVETNKYHILATHDFDLLLQLYNIYGTKMDSIEIIFFKFSQRFVEKKMKKFPYVIKNKSFYKPYGKICLSFLNNFTKYNFYRMFQRRYIGKVN